ncbi:MAG: Hpt domain-containing protein [Desulfobacterales bacterium]|nr:Hpt domain-containing protein [Desulfobacterales bacterium]MBF0396247.1 Hpt domain-containing protein [Desulfobacterales bacterium]
MFKELAENLGLDEDEFRELAVLIVDTAAGDIERLEEAAQKGDATLASEASHSLKGAAGNLGFMELSDIARQIEEKARKKSIEGISEGIALIKEQVNLISKELNG